DALRNDLLSILSLIHHSVTKLALALKPSNPAYSASLSPLKDITNHVASIVHCARLFNTSQGLTLIAEVNSVVKQVLDGIRSLAQTLLDVEAHTNRTASGKAGDEYMVRAAAVHDLIDKARTGLSIDNISAVRKLWLRDQASLDDGLSELVEMIDSNDAEDEVEEEEDGWDELGLATQKMSPIEVERAKKVQAVLRLSTLLHKYVSRDLLSSTYQRESNAHLDTLPQQSSALLVASDDLVATMYSPQDEESIAAELISFRTLIQNMRSLFDPLLEQNEKIKLRFRTCFDHILKAIDAVSDHCP
ncbi:hypothetical protein JOM56_003538, partial [Amanita muscaria]